MFSCGVDLRALGIWRSYGHVSSNHGHPRRGSSMTEAASFSQHHSCCGSLVERKWQQSSLWSLGLSSRAETIVSSQLGRIPRMLILHILHACTGQYLVMIRHLLFFQFFLFFSFGGIVICLFAYHPRHETQATPPASPPASAPGTRASSAPPHAQSRRRSSG